MLCFFVLFQIVFQKVKMAILSHKNLLSEAFYIELLHFQVYQTATEIIMHSLSVIG